LLRQDGELRTEDIRNENKNERGKRDPTNEAECHETERRSEK
jgi:hypothetical protein